MTEPLKPCPFCGSNKIDRQECLGDYWVACLTCLASSHTECSEEIADERWNARADLDEIAALKKGLRFIRGINEASAKAVGIEYSIHRDETAAVIARELENARAEIVALKKQVDGLIGKEGRDYCTKIENERNALKKELEIAREEVFQRGQRLESLQIEWDRLQTRQECEKQGITFATDEEMKGI